MAEAGYEDGFSVTMLTNSSDPDATNAVAAAVEQLVEIGIDIQIKSEPETTFYSEIATKKYPLGAVSWGLLGDVVLDADRLYQLPYSAVWNPFASVDADLTAAYEKLATSDDASLEQNAIEFNDLMTEKAWYIPVTYSRRYVYSKGIDIGTAGPIGEFDVASWKSRRAEGANQDGLFRGSWSHRPGGVHPPKTRASVRAVTECEGGDHDRSCRPAALTCDPADVDHLADRVASDPLPRGAWRSRFLVRRRRRRPSTNSIASLALIVPC